MPRLLKAIRWWEPSRQVAQSLGSPTLPSKWFAGAGDSTAAAAIGTGIVEAGGCNISLGTSGTIFIFQGIRREPPQRPHAFAHADGGWHLMGCMLSAASCNKWLCMISLKTTDYEAEQKDITPDKLGKQPRLLPSIGGRTQSINDYARAPHQHDHGSAPTWSGRSGRRHAIRVL